MQIFMMGIVYLFFLFCLSSSLTTTDSEFDNNPFYVLKENTSDPQIWKINLANHHKPSPLNSTNPELMNGSVTIQSVDTSVLHFKLVNASGQRWEPFLFNQHPMKDYHPGKMADMNFTYEKDPFTFTIKDRETSEVLVTSSTKFDGTLKFFDKYLELGLWYPNKRISGLGERSTPDFELCHNRKDCVYTIFGKDQLNPIDKGEPPGGKQTYGNHPFYMIQLKNGKFIGTFLMNSNAQDAIIIKRPNDEINVIHKIVGGVIDVYFFYPTRADDLLKKYHDIIGRPYMVPFWSLGYHQCRWGWKTLNVVKEVVAKLEEADIPLEVMWGDIDYMLNRTDFTIDPVNYKGLPQFVDDLHKKKIKYVPIIDAGLNYSSSDKYIKYGEINKCFIKSANTSKTLIGQVWPGYTAYVDFLAPSGPELWKWGLRDLYEQMKFDGIWLDMNELANWCKGGECYVNISDLVEAKDPHDFHEFDNLPYTPGGAPLWENTISMTGYHFSRNEFEDKNYKEYNMHGLWPVFQEKATHEFLKEHLQKRPFIMSRSSFVGAGLYTTLWTADVEATWEFMRWSLISVFNFQQFGVPMSGGDLCGFFRDTTEELCGRWMQLGAFYPLTRNHGAADAINHEPYVFGERVAMASRNAIRQKYSILQYYYTKLYEVSLYGGGVVSPLFYEFPNDEKAYKARNDTFLIGTSLLVIPVMYKGASTVDVYCPNANWYDLRSRVQKVVYDVNAKEGKVLNLPGGFDFVNVFIRGGSIIPFQDALSFKVRRTATLLQIPVELIIAPDHNGNAYGTWILDDWDTVDPIENKWYKYLSFNFSMNTFQMTVNHKTDFSIKYQYEQLSRMVILGAQGMGRNNHACFYKQKEVVEEMVGKYDSNKHTLSFFLARSKYLWSDISEIHFRDGCK